MDTTVDLSLGRLFDRLGSDKASQGHGHGYDVAYEFLIDRARATRLVEIGVGTFRNFNGSCGSILAWLLWLKQAEVIGFDAEEPTVDISDPRFRFVRGDQGCREDLERLAKIAHQCDMIIDDGSHLSDHQLLTLDVMWPSLRKGGFYVIEDAHFRWGPPPHPIDVLPADPRFFCRIGRHGGGVVLRKR
jgi:cephalosporin hydroxylase